MERTCEGFHLPPNAENLTDLPVEDDANSAFEACAISTASTLSFCIGLIHILMGILRLEIITTYFSDQLIAGFTTAASCQVFSTQLKGLFGIDSFKDPSGAANTFRRLYLVGANMGHANVATCITSASTIATLVIGKEFLSPFLQRKFRIPVPLPVELFVVIMATLISFLVDLNGRFDVNVVKQIPTG